MTTAHTILCGGVDIASESDEARDIRLSISGSAANIFLKISDISNAMARNIPAVLVDLLELAAYVFAADQAIGRGSRRDTGIRWRRNFVFHVPVRLPDLWSNTDVKEELVNTLSFLSDDNYTFHFSKLRREPSVQLYLENFVRRLDAEEVVLFSGGIDSLGGAVNSVIGKNKNLALVSHRSAPKRIPTVDHLTRELAKRSEATIHHVPVCATKAQCVGREYTQRTRSFLYASLAGVVARMLGLDKFYFYENGVTSMNLPITSQLVGSRASRTTHPQSLNGFSRLFSLLFDRSFSVESPFIWLTKAEVLQSIKEEGCADLVKHTISCSRTVEATKLLTHCGRCSQCIDRRFATLAAGYTDAEDPSEMYKVQLLTDPRAAGEDRTMAESFLRQSLSLRTVDEFEFFKIYPEATRVLRHVGLDTEEAAHRIYDLHLRRGEEVHTVLSEGLRRHAAEFQEGSLPDSCLLVLGVPERYIHRNAVERVPTFRRRVDFWDIWFENEEAALKDGVGPRYVALLLAHPGRNLHVIDMLLAEADLSSNLDPSSQPPHAGGFEEAGFEVRHSPATSGGSASDHMAVRQYRVRLDNIDEEIRAARSRGNPASVSELEEEKENIEKHIRSVLNIRRSPRPSADDDERARGSVTKAIKRTIEQLWKKHKPLARHLGKHLNTGLSCRYNPDPPVTWVTE